MTLTYLFFNWICVIGSIYCAVKLAWFYPIAVIIVANRLSANYLVGHEAVHGLVVKNPLLNDIIGSVFCHFPVFISFETYKFYHLTHHKFLGTNLDPDKSLYDFYPQSKGDFFKKLLKEILSLKIFLDFSAYFMPFHFSYRFKNQRPKIKNDLIAYLIFFGVLILFLSYFSLWTYYLKFWLVPILIMVPYYYFISALQHGSIHLKPDPRNSRNITGPFLLMEFLLPCQANLHGVHHMYPTIKFFRLPGVMKVKGIESTTLATAVKELIV